MKAIFPQILTAFSLLLLAIASASGGDLIHSGHTAGEPIVWNDIGAKAGAQYQGKGDALSVIAVGEGARLRCGFQKMDGEATPEGLWLTTTAAGANGERFRVTASSIGRGDAQGSPLLPTGGVRVTDSLARWERPGVTEEYSVSVDGVRQDFLVTDRPTDQGKLSVLLEVSGAKAEASQDGVTLTLKGSGRKIAYSRLRVSDARGRELDARMLADDAARVRIEVDDSDASYPIRIDPTFSDANWSAVFGDQGTTDVVHALAMDGAGNLYVGGNFTSAGGLTVNYIAKWNGSSWAALGSGLARFGGGGVDALAVDGAGNLYAGGLFDFAGGVPANNIAKWNGSTWSALGSGISSGPVNALAVDGAGNLYVAGSFSTAGGVPAICIAKWNGSVWSALGSGVSSGVGISVSALAVDGAGNLYVGGHFTTAGSVPANKIAKWNGSTWSALGSGIGVTPFDSGVSVLAVDGAGNLYVGGSFTTAGGVPANNIAKWNGSAWSALGTGVAQSVDALAVDGAGNVYAGGYFTNAGGVPANHIAKWNGSAWSALSSEIEGTLGVHALALDGAGSLYAGGFFTKAGGVLANYVAKWSSSAWHALGMGISGGVSALTVDGAGKLYAGIGSSRAGGVAFNSPIATWDGTAWSGLGSGISGGAGALAWDGAGNLYAGGDFLIGGVSTSVVKWNGSVWTALGSRMGTYGNYTIPDVRALAVDGAGNVYAGGHFTTAGGVAAYGIAKWNGSAWSALGSGADTVNALAMDGAGNLYAGGFFTSAGGVPANHIAKWNGSAWAAIGGGTDKTVVALAISGTDLYVGGDFTMAGAVTASGIAKWNGSAWSALGSGISQYGAGVLKFDGAGNLYAGGNFGTAGGVTASNIAKWNGSAWSALGSGIGTSLTSNPSVLALAVDSAGNLYAGGAFNIAGGKPSVGIARAVFGGSLPTGSLQVSISPTGAVSAGAQWRVNGGAWQNSGATVSGLSVGGHLVDFSTVSGWTTPPSQTVTVNANQTTPVTGTYVVIPPSNNADLASLILSAGTLSPVFSNATTSYTGSVPNATVSVTVTPTVAQANATMKVNGTTVASGTASGAIALNVGANVITTVVTAQDGVTTKSYTVTVTRASGPSNNADLASLVPSVGTLSPVFSASTTSYTEGVPNATVSMTVTPTVAQAGATVKVNGTPVASGTASGVIALNVGANTIATLVTAQDGTTTKTYTITVTRASLPSTNANLASLLPGAPKLAPAFDPAITNYTATVQKSALYYTVMPTVQQAGATVTVSAATLNSGNPTAVVLGSASPHIPLNIGSNTITVVVTAPFGNQRAYGITVTRASRDVRGDMNNDRNADLVFQNNVGQVAAWYMNGAGVNTSTVLLSNSALGDWSVKGVADMNGDGNTDLLFQNTLGQIVVWSMDGVGAKTSSGYLSTSALGDWRVVSVADMNNDGNGDIIFQNNAGQLVVWYRNGGGAVTSSVYLTTSALGDWRVVGVADMNNDGNADLIFQNTTGQVFAWYMDGAGTKTASGYLNTGALGDWRVVGVADMNNDGNADLIFQNTIGQIVAWYMDGAGTKTSSGYLSIGGLGDWRVR